MKRDSLFYTYSFLWGIILRIDVYLDIFSSLPWSGENTGVSLYSSNCVCVCVCFAPFKMKYIFGVKRIGKCEEGNGRPETERSIAFCYSKEEEEEKKDFPPVFSPLNSLFFLL
jgi:hypothetical protein